MKLPRLVAKLRTWLPDRSRAVVAVDTILVMRRDISPAADHAEFALTVYDRYDPALIDIYRAAGGEISEERARSRFGHRLKYYQLTREGETVAWTWLIPPGLRFIDEAGYHFPVPDQATWIRDIFVAPRYRGRKMFSVLLDVLASRALVGDREIWSDTATRNRPSVKAHLGAGFRIVDSLKILRLNQLLLIRLRLPVGLRHRGGYQPDRRFLLTGKAFRAYKKQHLA